MTTQAFEDFYALLGISQSATPVDIRRAFHARIREWHPDVNPSPQATAFTQSLIVAYKILTDAEARSRYDCEYALQCRQMAGADSIKSHDTRPKAPAPEPCKASYRDPDLDRWVRTARKEAAEEWRQFTSEFQGASKAALGGATRAFVMMIIFAVIGFILSRIL